MARIVASSIMNDVGMREHVILRWSNDTHLNTCSSLKNNYFIALKTSVKVGVQDVLTYYFSSPKEPS